MTEEASRKICVITGSRAEYGILRPVMEAIRAHPRLELQVLVTGMHLAPGFGETWREITADGFAVDERVAMLLSSDSGNAIAKSMGVGMIGFADALERLNPDVVLVLGDRFEILAAAQAAFMLGMPIAHVAGGEVTEGAKDDAMRHCISRMAWWHFVTAEEYGQRLARMGEPPRHIFVTGSPALDNILKRDLLPREETCEKCGLDPRKPYFLVTYHPVTTGKSDPAAEARALVEALRAFPRHQVLVTLSNADEGGRAINDVLQRAAREAPERIICRESLGMELYLSAMKHCAAVIGNSSSGLFEAPALKVPTVNIGPRQDGRIRAASVLDCPPRREDIVKAVSQALSASFREVLRETKSPYGDGGAARRICAVLASGEAPRNPRKPFHDLPEVSGFALGETP